MLQLFTAIALSMITAEAQAEEKPNIVYIYADDLGYGELGSYGQSVIKTPHLDKLAASGMRFTQHYSGSPVCAPSRCVLMTGFDTGRAYVRDNSEWRRDRNPFGEGQEPLRPDDVTIAELLKEQGYNTAVAGKWGLGGPTTTGIPTRQGFDDFFGYHCQRQAHSYYPGHLWHNEKQVPLNTKPIKGHYKLKEAPEDWSVLEGERYAPEAIAEHLLNWIEEVSEKDEPFFLWYTSVIPHLALHVPDAKIKEYGYDESMDTDPYLGNKGYTPHPRPNAAYASMITYLDEQVGRIIALLKEKGELDNTLIIFSSDNGTTYLGGVDRFYFNSLQGMRGHKGSVFEGGLRVPMIASWPNQIEAGATSDLVCAQVDMLPTLIEAAGGNVPEGIDGVSLLNRMMGVVTAEQPRPEFYYWELGNQQAIRQGDWKLVRVFNKAGKPTTYLFNIAEDRNEQSNLADKHPERVKAMIQRIIAHRTMPEVNAFRNPAFSSETVK
ncbi:MAG: arylsulfatase [Planctomycetota bacterium]